MTNIDPVTGQTYIEGTQQENIIETILRLGEEAASLKAEIDELEAVKLVELKSKLKNITERLLPDAMNSVQLTELKLRSGKKIALKESVFANVPKAKIPEVVEWLEDNMMDGIVTRTYEVTKEVTKHLDQCGIEYKTDVSIHNARLRAFVTERLEADPNFPKQLFGVSVVPVVTFK